MITLAPLSQIDPGAVEALLDAAFGADRHTRTAYMLREGVDAIAGLSFAAVDAGVLVGALLSWPIELCAPDGTTEPLVMIGPVAVLPSRQRDGIGKQLMIHALAAADAIGEDALMLIGDPEYYDRFFGFTAEFTGGWSVPGPVERRRLLARLTRGRRLAASGTLRPRSAGPATLR